MTPKNIFSKRLLFAIVLIWAAQCVAQQLTSPTFPDPGHPSMSREQQQQLGFQAAAEVYKQMPVLPDSSPETQYVRQIGQRLAATIPQQYSWPFEFHVVAQKEINAFALPGGPMFVNIGTITSAANEAELAGVMGHEMAHVYMQHSAKQAQKAQVTEGIAGIAGAILGMKGGALGQLGQMGVQLGAGTLMMKYSRSDESQADQVGALILYKAGYNPQALADFFKTLAASGSQGPQFLSDHPNPGNREAAIQSEIRDWPPEKYRTDNAAFAKAKQHATGVKAYTAQQIADGAKANQWDTFNRKNGAVYKNAAAASTSGGTASAPTPTKVSTQSVMPSGRMISTDMGPLKMSRPDNWDLIPPKQQGESVTIAPKAGIAGNGIGYGVVINAVGPGNNMSLDQVTSELIRSMQQGGSDLKTVSSAQAIQVAGASGRSVHMQSTSPFTNASGQKQMERDWLVTVPRQDGSVFYFVFVAPESEFAKFQPTFTSMLNSVKF